MRDRDRPGRLSTNRVPNSYSTKLGVFSSKVLGFALALSAAAVQFGYSNRMKSVRMTLGSASFSGLSNGYLRPQILDASGRPDLGRDVRVFDAGPDRERRDTHQH